MPAAVLTASSIGFVTCDSISSGEAPRNEVVTVTIGISILGIKSTPSVRYEKKPRTRSRTVTIEARTGLRMKMVRPSMVNL